MRQLLFTFQNSGAQNECKEWEKFFTEGVNYDMKEKEIIESGNAILGIEFGSTRIKAVLTGDDYRPIASGSHEWENRLENGIWTYDLTDVWEGLRHCYQTLSNDVKNKYGVSIKRLGAIGFSGMMHGYMAFDANGELLVPFRTWRNTMTSEASEKLTETFGFHIPQRWSIAHLYQAILNQEEHVGKIRYLTTLAGYIHWKLTGEKVLGVGEASGMFPIDSKKGNYNRKMMEQFNALEGVDAYPWRLEEILPQVRLAGEAAGLLTEEGAALLDPDHCLEAGIMLAPPEGDAGTGMAATNSVGIRTGNVSAGTSVFAMVVLEEALKSVHKELDLVTTPSGETVAMVHCNNCTSDLNAWAGLFGEFAESMGISIDKDRMFTALYQKALEGEKDGGGLVSFNCLSGEPVIGLNEGRPLLARRPDARLTLANFMRTHLYASLAALKIGCDILFKEERVKADTIYGHGGFFKTKGVGQRILAAALNAPVAVMETAGEGGPWGMALLAAYRKNREEGETLERFLREKVFSKVKADIVQPEESDVEGFDSYLARYKEAIAAEKAIIHAL